MLSGSDLDACSLKKLIEELKAGSPVKENQQPQAPAITGGKPPTAPGPSKPVLAPSRRNVQLSSSANRHAAMRQQLEVLSYTVYLSMQICHYVTVTYAIAACSLDV